MFKVFGLVVGIYPDKWGNRYIKMIDGDGDRGVLFESSASRKYYLWRNYAVPIYRYQYHQETRDWFAISKRLTSQ